MASNRLLRIASFLSGYQFDISCVKSDSNIADYFSRFPQGSYADEDDICDNVYLNFFKETTKSNRMITCENIRIETERDDLLQKLTKRIREGWPEKNRDAELLPYFVRRTELSEESGCLFWGFRVIIPRRLQEEIIEFLHSTHMGIIKMKAMARKCCWWPTQSKDLERIALSCESCLWTRMNPPRNELLPWKRFKEVWSRVHIDFFEPFKKRWCLIIVDSTSKWLECVDMGTNTTSTAVIAVLRETFARFGLPRILVSDNGTQFVSKQIENFLEINEIQHITSSVGYPATNGLTENSVKTVKNALSRSLYNAPPAEFNNALNRFLLDYRNTYLMFNRRKLRCRLNIFNEKRKVWFQNRRAKWRKAERLKDEQRKRENGDCSSISLNKLHGSRESSPDITGEIDDDEPHHSPGPVSSQLSLDGGMGADSDNDRPLSSNPMHSGHSGSQSMGSISAGSPSPGLRTPRNPTNSPSNSRNTDSPIEVGGPLSLSAHCSSTSTTPTTTLNTATAQQLGTHIFATFGNSGTAGGNTNANNNETNCGFRPVFNETGAGSAGRPNHTTSLFLPPHLASLSSQFSQQPLFPSLKGVPSFPGLCSCCTVKPPHSAGNSMTVSCSLTKSSPNSPTHSNCDPRSSSVAELRRKAQEHSAALLQSLHAAAAAGLAFPGLHLPPLSFHHHTSLTNAHHHATASAIRLKNEAQDMTASTMNGLVANMMPSVTNLMDQSSHNSNKTPPLYQQHQQHEVNTSAQLSPPTIRTKISNSSKDTPLNCTNGTIITKSE